MRYLLDTHTFLWFLADDAQLSSPARDLIADGTNTIVLSVGSLWEIAIKVSLGKLTLSQPYATLIPTQLLQNSVDLLQITVNHAALLAVLPFHHRDPFDRLLIAQALVEQMPIIGTDTVFDSYGVTRLW